LVEVGSEVDPVEGRDLFDEGQYAERPAPPRGVLGADHVGTIDVVVVLQPQSQLLQVVDALTPTGRLASGLHGWEQQGNQHGDDGDDNEQFDQREAAHDNARRRTGGMQSLLDFSRKTEDGEWVRKI
jgi:hypothetical protein